MVLSGLGADPQAGLLDVEGVFSRGMSAGSGAIAPRRSDFQHGPCACISKEGESFVPQ